MQLSATTSGINDVKEVVKVAKNEQQMFKRKTVLFVDEIHRFNKLQQVIIIFVHDSTDKIFFSFGFFLLHVHGSYNLEKVLNSVKVLEKYLISFYILGIEKSLKFTTLSNNIFVHEQYFTVYFCFFILNAVFVVQMQLQVTPSNFPKHCWERSVI